MKFPIAIARPGRRWHRPEILLVLMVIGVPLSFETWQSLLNNFAVREARFSGAEIGILQSLREVPGFLSFAVVWLLIFIREQKLAYLALGLLGLGTAATGFFPSVVGLYLTTVLMSLGFHYYETVFMSLSLQWIDRDRAPQVLGRLIAVRSAVTLVTLGLIWLAFDRLSVGYRWTYVIGGGLTIAVAAVAASFPDFGGSARQKTQMVFRRRYWLYYALTFMAGARRQIFVVFAAFLMVEKFHYDVSDIALLMLINAAANIVLAPRVGRWIARFGERKALTCEYLGLIVVFVAYAFVDHPGLAAALYVVDHLFYSAAIAIKTYFQKIADDGDLAATAGVSFTINHIAAVALPAGLGLLWLHSPVAVFLCGALMACLSLGLARLIPTVPSPGNEARWKSGERIV